MIMSLPSPLPSLPDGPELTPLTGDYGIRESGLMRMMRPREMVSYDVLYQEMRAGIVADVPQWAIVGYGLLRLYAKQYKRDLGAAPSGICEHPLAYLWSATQLQGSCSGWPPLVLSAYSELIK